ncbi:uncharacterized protein PHALS_11323 [Plasmopara halstedii]|uniref:Uncharacterized protein n=1 Tax=Plasmopara halstedii TaxID=4781 RepID=A0A0P1AKK7_PLAHL|nr:uncharacterized protein PHALS_11323 [Plasmopara halstedii]CEG41160.1 hypothetical protein PHALS_11323 [Plasmopara halstedii]|eukprot:XP_024577529.1 hypothetical protein PHALS_11323 [Plasmopara halstedii]
MEKHVYLTFLQVHTANINISPHSLAPLVSFLVPILYFWASGKEKSSVGGTCKLAQQWQYIDSTLSLRNCRHAVNSVVSQLMGTISGAIVPSASSGSEFDYFP